MPITRMEEPYPDEETLSALHPIVREWFESKFGRLSPPQRYSILNIHRGTSTLISSPTGSGKTLSAFLAILNHLIILADRGELAQKVYCVYVSPLKALANDITKNLKEPLAEIQELARKKYAKKYDIAVGSRTGDTTPSKRASMLAKPPHILITTPESLAISLTTVKFRELLRTTRYLIIDEIHALAENKRGVHLMLSAERLELLINEENRGDDGGETAGDAADNRLVRIGLSATVSPLEEVAKFLVGLDNPATQVYRDCSIVDVQAAKRLDLKVLCPVDDIMRASHARMQAALYDLLHDLIQSHKTTLVFTNTRAATERVVHQLKARYPRAYSGVMDADDAEAKTEAESEAETLDGEDPSLRATPDRLSDEALEEGEGTAEEDTKNIGEPTNYTDDPPSKPALRRSSPSSGSIMRALDDSEDSRGGGGAVEGYPSGPPRFSPSNETEAIVLEGPGPEALEAKEAVARKRGLIGAHHGSLSKTHRLGIENMLKRGELKAVVCSTSLELGIDIGSIDLVILLGSPKSVARGLQRIGRSGHKLDEEAKGRIIVLDRDDMVECSVLLKAAIEKKIDKVHIPTNCLDVLAQQLFGLAIEKVRSFEELYWTVRRCHCYSALSREDFSEVMAYLAGEYVSLEERHVYAKIWYDRETGMVGRRGKLARLIYLTNVGTIPDETSVRVKIGEETIGTIDEGFLERLHPGDVFVLGGETYEFKYARGLTAQVKSSAGRPPTVPSWASEMLPLSFDLANEIQTFRKYLEEMFDRGRGKADIISYADGYLYADARTLSSIHEYFREQHRYALIPHRGRLLIEHFREGQKRHVIVHSLYGRRVNDVLSRALAYALGRIHSRDVAITITDNGFSLRSNALMDVRRALSLLKADELERVMTAALEKSEVLARRFRHCAARALMILRTYKGEAKSVGKQQMSSRLLLSAVKRVGDDFPVLREARREVLEDLMDLPSAADVLRQLETGKLRVDEIHTELPSPFAFNIVLQGYTDILKVEERREFLKRMHELILKEIDAPDSGARKAAREEAKSEKGSFSYEELWREAEERRLAEQGERTAELKRIAWNLEGVPLYIKEEIAKLLDGAQSIRPDVSEMVEREKDKILSTWPPELTASVFDRLGVSYDPEALREQEYCSLLKQQFRKGARKTGLDPMLVVDADKLIDSGEMSEALGRFVSELLGGTVPKPWDDEIVKFLASSLRPRAPRASPSKRS